MEFVTKKTSRFLVNSALDKETLSKKGEIGQAFHRERSTVWLDKKFTLSTRKTSQNNYSKVDITIFFFFFKNNREIADSKFTQIANCVLWSKVVAENSPQQTHLSNAVAASVFENWTKNKAPFFKKKMQSVKTFSFISLPTKKRKRIHLRLCLPTT